MNSFCGYFWAWSTEHWFLGFVLICFFLQVSIIFIIRTYRLILILLRGWPTNPNMNVDGQLLRPKPEKKGKIILSERDIT